MDPPPPQKPGGLLHDNGRITLLFPPQGDSEIVGAATSITGLCSGPARAGGAAGALRSSGVAVSTALHHMSATCARAGWSSAAAGAARAANLGSIHTAPRVQEPWGHGCLQLGLKGWDQQAMEQQGWDLSLLSSFPFLLFGLGISVLCPSYHFVFWKHKARLLSQAHSWGICLRINLTLSLTHIRFRWYLEEILDFTLLS